MSIARFADSAFRSALQWYPALVLSGARQSGKTTLLRELFPGYHYVTLDLPSLAEQAEKDPELFFRQHPPPVLIDEVQYAPGLFRHIKILIDRNRDKPGQFVLTGSQSFPLMKGVSDSLAGRCVWYTLENLSLGELTLAGLTTPESPDWPRLLSRGQFPELWRLPDMPCEDFHRSYLTTYLERDVRQILNVTSLRDFERFIRLLAARSGQLLNKTDLARDVGVSVRAITDWIAVLEASGQIILLEPWFKSFGKRIVKTPKVYFRDSGLLCHLLGLDESSLLKSPFLGAVWEGFVFAEFRKRNDFAEKKGRFWFYRDQSGQEIDLIFERDGCLDLYEIKWSALPVPADVAPMEKIRRMMEPSGTEERPGTSSLVCRTPSEFPLTDTTRAVNPFSLLQRDGG